MNNLRNNLKKLAVIGLLASTTCANAESINVSGSSALTYADRKVAAIPNTQGEMLLMGTVTGTAKSTGPMDGAKVTNEEIAQLFQGNGDHAGYYTLSNDDGSMIAKWNGHVTTVMKDGNPMTTFKGKWEYVSGSGKYQSVKGKGDYNGYFTSPDSYVVDWKGFYSLDK